MVWVESLVSRILSLCWNIVNTFAMPIILSTCTLLLAIFLSFYNVEGASLFFFLKNAGMFMCTSIGANMS